MGTNAVAPEQFVEWPQLPYKGLSYYGPKDRALFAGREDEIQDCARLLSLSSTRIMILHGGTGSGKSSFLQAGLIPFLEGGSAGFAFVKEENASSPKALFIRCTDVPLGKLAQAIQEFVAREHILNTPLGPRPLDLSKALLGYTTNDFIEHVSHKPTALVRSLEAIAAALPRTLVIVIDQGEEVLTLKPGSEGELYRKDFFGFIGNFSETKFDLKLLIAIRTEYYGRFQTKIRAATHETLYVRDFLLGELTEDQLVEAIERPTLKKPIGDSGVPFDRYHFSFGPDLSRKIAKDLLNAAVAGGTLPVMQIVCGRLFEKTRDKSNTREQWEITSDDYLALEGIESQIDAYVREILEHYCSKVGIKEYRVSKEINSWRWVLSQLARMQVDGTVTTEMKTTDTLRAEAARANCHIDFDDMMRYLAHDDQRILREVEVVSLTSRKPIACFTLGHDAIGLVLQRWKESYLQLKARAKRTGISFVFSASVLLIAVGIASLALRLESSTLWMGVGYGILFLFVGIRLLLTEPTPYSSDATIESSAVLRVLTLLLPKSTVKANRLARREKISQNH